MTTKSETEISKLLEDIAIILDLILIDELKEKTGFVLLVTPFNLPNTNVNYISNCTRESGTEMIESLLARWQEEKPDIPLHEKN